MRQLIALTVAALLSGTALAQQESQVPPTSSEATQPPTSTPNGPSQAVNVEAIFDKLDVNHDGKLTREEAQAHPTVASHFDSADANHDGVVTKEEFMAAFHPQE